MTQAWLSYSLLKSSDEVPAGFAKKIPTVLDWDNIDFGEKNPSGHGITHHTNGIMLQSHISESTPTSGRASLPKRVCSLKGLPSFVREQHHQNKMQGPKHVSGAARATLEVKGAYQIWNQH